MNTPEQDARDLLERMGVRDAQDYTAGELVELANLISALGEQEEEIARLWEAVRTSAGLAETRASEILGMRKQIARLEARLLQSVEPDEPGFFGWLVRRFYRPSPYLHLPPRP